MDLSVLFHNFSVLALAGALMLLLGKIYAFSRLPGIKGALFFSALAETGYVLLAFGAGDENALWGAGFYLLSQLIVRSVLYVSARRLLNVRQSTQVEGLRGLIEREPVLAAVFGLSLFSAVGFSPFKGSPAKVLLLYSLIGAGQYLSALLVLTASLIELACFLKIFHMLCRKEEGGTAEEGAGSGKKSRRSVQKAEQPVSSGLFKGLLIAACLPPILLGWFQEPIMRFLGFAGAAELESPWPWLVLIPYLSAFGIYLLGRISPFWRNLGAIGVSLLTTVLVYQSAALDGLSRLFALIMAGGLLLVVLYSTAYLHHKKHTNRYFFFLMLMLSSLVGITAADRLGDFYTLWELMTLSSYFLVIHEQTEEALQAGYKYFLMCTAGAYGILFAFLTLINRLQITGFGELSGHIPALPGAAVLALALLLFLGFGVKIGLVPVHSWLPAAHPAAPSSISAPMSGILTKIGIYGVLRLVFVGFGLALFSNTLLLPGGIRFGTLMGLLGAITVLYGDIKALGQSDVKKMLAYSTMAQVGEIVIALGCANYISLVGGLSHVLNHAIMKNLLFLAVGAMIYRAKGQQIDKLKGIGRKMPLTALCFSIGILGIMGLPPFGGFISKFLMLYGLIQGGQWVFAGVILLGSLLGGIYYLRLVRVIYFEKYEGPTVSEAPWAMRLPSLVLALLVVLNGLFPQGFLTLIRPAADLVAGAGGIAVSAVPDMAIHWPWAVVLPMLGGMAAYLVGRRNARAAGGVGVAALIGTALVLFFTRGQFSVLTGAYAVLVAGVGILNVLYSIGYMHHSHAQNRFYYFFLTMIGGLLGVALSSDLLSFFAFWEIMSSWALYFAIIHEETEEALREGFKYFIFNYTGASLMLFGILMLATGTGHLALGGLAERLGQMPPARLMVALLLIVVGLVMKAAMLPFRIDYQMHPPAAPTPVSGYISAVLLKSAPFSILKLIYLTVGLNFFVALSRQTLGINFLEVLVWVSSLTILWASIKALQQDGLKKILIFSTVSQMGYVLLGVSLGTTWGVAGGLLHFVNHMMFKNLLFLGAGAIMTQAGAHSLAEVSGLGRRMPVTVGTFAIGAFSAIGLPPFSGFVSKLLIYQGAMAAGEVVPALISLAASVITMAYLVKFLHAAFFGPLPERLSQVKEAPATMLTPMVLLAAVSVGLGLAPSLPLTVIGRIQTELGQPAIDAHIFSLSAANGLWSSGVMTVLLLAGALVSLAVYWGRRAKVRYTEVYTCGNGDLQPEELQLPARQLFETPLAYMNRVLSLGRKIWPGGPVRSVRAVHPGEEGGGAHE